MDREIDPEFRRKQIIRRGIYTTAAVTLIAVVFVWGPALIKPSVSRARIRTARVDAGPIEATLSASGIVVPEFEQVLSSPISARVVRILKRPGAVLSKGDPIVELDMSESVLALEKMNQQIELKENQQARARLDLQNKLITLKSQWEIKNLEHKSAAAVAARNRQLHKQGLLSEDILRQSELLEEKARFELKQIEDSRLNAEKSTGTELEGLALEMKTLEKEKAEARRQLELATTKSDRDGVLTWVVAEEGATVQKGDVLARIADLSSFRIRATTSDVHAGRLAPGLATSVKINEQYLDGHITSIEPTITDGVITFLVGLADKSSQLLRSNLRVDVLVMTDRKERALRIKKGPFAGSDGAHDVFVIRGESAVKTPVRIGLSSFDNYEVIDGLLEGDEVIVSEMADYMHLKEVKIK
ncbi:MAG TPA: HlyD family efflux transporter periplasmic adaptor subunit [Blastocatellia bacterium]|nr:HlyD family efflux transporter periplasmic adaptor subunit [Blastocatellia bacterium]